MAKQSHNIKRFDAGLNNKDSQKDLTDGFLAEATNVNIGHLGKIITTGKLANLGSTYTLTDDGDAAIQPGYGLFKFSSDITPGGGAAAAEYLAYTSPKGEVFLSTSATFGSGAVFDSAVYQADESTANLLAEALDNSETAVDVDFGGAFDIGDVFKVGTEKMIVTAIAGNTLTVTRGYNSTTAAAHNDNSTMTTSTSLLISGSATDAQPVYYYADGGLRIADSDFGNTGNEQIVLARIEKTNDEHPDVYAAAVTDQMKFYNGGLSAPLTADFESLASPVDEEDGVEDGSAPSTAGAEFRFKLASTGTGSSSSRDDGLWPEGAYVIGVSYVYFGGQESLLSNPFSPVTIADAQYFITSMSIKDDSLSSFLQGMRIYVKNYNNPDDEYRLLLDVNFELGSRVSLADEYDPFIDKSGYVVTNDTNNPDTDATSYHIKSPALDTYSTINGFLPEEKAITFNGAEAYAYKTATVANQRAFVGNVLYVNDEGVPKEMGDRIQYTPVRKYDTFPQTYYLDVGTNDGDAIVKLIEFADRLFVFKKNKLFIINIASGSDAGWYVEGEFENRGISHPAAVAKSDLGLVWVNENGMFSFSDTVNKLSGAIDEDKWATNIVATSCSVGFIPKTNQILVIGDSSSTDSKGYIYDVATKSFVNINDTNALVSKKTTNLVTYNQELVCMELTTGTTAGAGTDDVYTVKRFDTDPQAQTIDIQTAEIDLGEPSVDKKFYAVYVTHKNADDLVITGGFEGAAPTTNIFDSNTFSTSSSMVTTKFKVASGSRVKKKSLQLKIAGDSQSDFEIQDIAIVFRSRGVRG